MLVTCPTCARHLRRSETHCPFCGSAAHQRKCGVSGALIAAAAVSLCACKPDSPAPAAPAASGTASPSVPSPAPSTPPSADLGRIELGRAAVYGAPPPPASASGFARGTVTLDFASPRNGAPANTDRVVRAMIPGFRACYNRALQTNPARAAKLQAKLRLTIHVAAGGEVTSATVTPDPRDLSAAIACIRARAMAALFEATGKQSVVTTDLTLALAP